MLKKKNQSKLSKKQLRSNSTKLFLFKGSTEKWTNKVMRSLKCPLYKARTIAEKCMKWALLCRKSNIKYYKKHVNLLRKTIKNNINHSVAIPDDHHLNFEFLISILGKSHHCKHSEQYFLDPVYKVLPNQFKTNLQINELGKIMNLFPSINDDVGVTWSCNEDICNFDYFYIIPNLLKTFKLFLILKLHDFPQKIKNIDLCSSETNSSIKLGHPFACHINFKVVQHYYSLKV